jgi:hypothetical protein
MFRRNNVQAEICRRLLLVAAAICSRAHFRRRDAAARSDEERSKNNHAFSGTDLRLKLFALCNKKERNMVRGNMVRGRFKTFVAVIFALAIVVAASYLFLGHPGDPKGNVKPLDTSSLTLQLRPVA